VPNWGITSYKLRLVGWGKAETFLNPGVFHEAAVGTERSGVTHVVPCGPKGERSE